VSAPAAVPRFEVRGVPGFPEVVAGDDLAGVLGDALRRTAEVLSDGDIVVVTSKIVSKAEGRVLVGVDRDAAIDAEAVRTVTEWTTPRGRTRIVETRHGLVMAAAGVDASNVAAGSVVLLPVDPDESARRLRDGIRDRLGVRVGVVITDTAGRAWRDGVVDMAVGAAGVRPKDDLRGRTDAYGNDLGVTVVAVADEIAAATELVRTKLSGIPVAIVSGLAHLLLPEGAADPGAAALVRAGADDRFRLGTPEAMREAVLNRRDVDTFDPRPVDGAAIRRALDSASSAPRADGGAETPWRLLIIEGPAKAGLAAAVEEFAPEIDARAVRCAAVALVPCVVADAGRGDSVPAATLSLGAAVENVLVTLAADGLGARWLMPTAQLDKAVLAAGVLGEGLVPAGVVVIGHPARTSG
jgi:coenzyme F420-0:L-glutamate ligase/coenzyme F420-1:gamma-L-glutamate ligase